MVTIESKTELEQLREFILQKDFLSALYIVDELEEMSRDDKIGKIESFVDVALVHLIKKFVENRMTASWLASINNSVERINKVNNRRPTQNSLLDKSQMREIVDSEFDLCVETAALQIFEGRMTKQEILNKVDRSAIVEDLVNLLAFKA